MSSPDYLRDQNCLYSLPQVAEALGVTRSAVNLMVRSGRLSAIRFGPRWYVSSQELGRFRTTYRPAPSAGKKLGRREGGPDMVENVLELLCDWGEARVDELSEVVQRDPGNVRKYLAILKRRGLARKTNECTWVPEYSNSTKSKKAAEIPLRKTQQFERPWDTMAARNSTSSLDPPLSVPIV